MREYDDRPLVAVLLGTDHHRFDRLVGWVAELAAAGDLRWFVQHGHTPLPTDLPGRPMLPVRDLGRLLDDADAVVTHGGPGLIMESRAAHHTPVVVPRDPARGEHVDDHQVMFARHLLQAGLVATAASAAELDEAVRRALTVRREASERALVRTGSRPIGSTETAQRFGDMVTALTSGGPLPPAAHRSVSDA